MNNFNLTLIILSFVWENKVVIQEIWDIIKGIISNALTYAIALFIAYLWLRWSGKTFFQHVEERFEWVAKRYQEAQQKVFMKTLLSAEHYDHIKGKLRTYIILSESIETLNSQPCVKLLALITKPNIDDEILEENMRKNAASDFNSLYYRSQQLTHIDPIQKEDVSRYMNCYHQTKKIQQEDLKKFFWIQQYCYLFGLNAEAREFIKHFHIRDLNGVVTIDWYKAPRDIYHLEFEHINKETAKSFSSQFWPEE